MTADDPFLSTGEAAEALGATTYLVRKWATTGALPAIRTPGGPAGPGQWRFRTSAVHAFRARLEAGEIASRTDRDSLPGGIAEWEQRHQNERA